MPFLAATCMPANAVLIDKTDYENPDDASDSLTLYITKPTVQLDETEVAKLEGVKVASLRSYLGSFSSEALKKTVLANNGVLTISLDDKEYQLRHKTHFFFDAKDRYFSENDK